LRDVLAERLYRTISKSWDGTPTRGVTGLRDVLAERRLLRCFSSPGWLVVTGLRDVLAERLYRTISRLLGRFTRTSLPYNFQIMGRYTGTSPIKHPIYSRICNSKQRRRLTLCPVWGWVTLECNFSSQCFRNFLRASGCK
jgi:hypothetical protein